jgi:phosphoribosyl 1,2-cyclic phosphate phosphodiesterase
MKKTLSWIRKIKPEKAILTHLNHEVDYDELSKMLPPGVEVGFDGMRITF